MVLVVAAHCSDLYKVPSQADLALVVYNLAFISIPLFFMASGYVLLARVPARATYAYVARKVWRIWRFIFLFGAAFYAAWWLLGEPKMRYGEMLEAAIFTRGPLFMLWFLTALTLVYLLYPLLARLWHRSRAAQLWMAWISAAALSVAFIFDWYGGFRDMVTESLRVWVWAPYFVLGGAMRLVRLRPAAAIAGTALSVAAWAAVSAALTVDWGISSGDALFACPVLALAAVAIFQLCLASKVRRSAAIDAAGALFLPVYVLHPWVRMVIHRFMPQCFGAESLVLTAATVAATLGISWLLIRMPLLRRLFTL